MLIYSNSGNFYQCCFVASVENLSTKACWGQATTHSPQRMHSAAPGFLAGFTPMGQALWHLPQDTQADLLTCRR